MPRIKGSYQRQEINEFSNRFSRIGFSAETCVHLIFMKLGPLREELAANSEDWKKWTMEDLADNLRKYVDIYNLNSEKWSNEYNSDKNSPPYRNSQSDRRSQSDRYSQSNRHNQSDRHSQSRHNQDKLFKWRH